MANPYFQFKQFTVHQEHCAMKVTTDGCLFGAWAAYQCQEQELQNEKTNPNVLDIGTGTGLLSLMLSQRINGDIDAIEIDPDACQQARENMNASTWKNSIHAIHGDARSFNFKKQYDIILSNPPFYENELRSGSSKKNKAHHDEGLLLEELLLIIKKNLVPRGKFFLLLPNKRNKEIEKFFDQAGLSIYSKILVKQSTQHDPFRIMIQGTHETIPKSEIITSEIDIKDDSNQYTPAFKKYLKDYYLYL